MIYLSEFLLVDDKNIYTIIGCYSFLAFFSCIIGSIISKYILSDNKIILMSLLLKTMGYISLYFFPQFNTTLFGLALLSMGGGMLKNSITHLYLSIFSSNDNLRVFYVFINIGLLISPIICGYCMAYSYFLPMLVLMTINTLSLISFSIYYLFYAMNNIDNKISSNTELSSNINTETSAVTGADTGSEATTVSNTATQSSSGSHSADPYNFYKLFSFLVVVAYTMSLTMSKSYIIHAIVFTTSIINLYLTFNLQTTKYTYYVLLTFCLITIFQIHIELLQLFYIKFLSNTFLGITVPLPVLSMITPLTIIFIAQFDYIWPKDYSYSLIIAFIILCIGYINLYYITFLKSFTISYILPVLLCPGICEAIVYIKVLQYSKTQNNQIILGLILHNVGIAYYVASNINKNAISLLDFQNLFTNIIYLILFIIAIIAVIYKTRYQKIETTI